MPATSDSSEDEQELQGQLDALQSKIAAIRARTSHEDELVPAKKPKKNTKSGPRVAAQPTTLMPSQVAKQPVFSSTPLVSEDPFKPPPSSQDVRSSQSRSIGSTTSAGYSVPPVQNSASVSSQRRPAPVRGTRAAPVKAEGAVLPSIKHEAKPQLVSSMPLTVASVPPSDVVDLTSSPPAPQPAPIVTVSEPVLCAEQQRVVDLIVVSRIRDRTEALSNSYRLVRTSFTLALPAVASQLC